MEWVYEEARAASDEDYLLSRCIDSIWRKVLSFDDRFLVSIYDHSISNIVSDDQ
jgi:hypothetical protein